MSYKNIIFFIVVSITILFVIELIFYLDDKKIVHDNKYKLPDTENFKYVQKDPLNVSLEQINSLNIIINDSKTSENFINVVCKELDKDGIRYLFTKNSENVDVDDAVVITLDQGYSVGPSTIIIAPYENNRLGNSDALALAAKTAFYEKGFIVDEVVSGKVSFDNKSELIN